MYVMSQYQPNAQPKSFLFTVIYIEEKIGDNDFVRLDFCFGTVPMLRLHLQCIVQCTYVHTLVCLPVDSM